jgi:transposase-like protein
MTSETEFDQTCRALVALEPLIPHRSRRAYLPSEFRKLARMYTEGKLTIPEIAERLGRHEQSIYQMLRILNAGQRRQPWNAGPKFDYRRRSEKVVDAILAGDSRETIARRWGITPRQVYEIADEYRRRTGMSRNAWTAFFIRR